MLVLFFVSFLIFALIGVTALVTRFLPEDRPYDAS